MEYPHDADVLCMKTICLRNSVLIIYSFVYCTCTCTAMQLYSDSDLDSDLGTRTRPSTRPLMYSDSGLCTRTRYGCTRTRPRTRPLKYSEYSVLGFEDSTPTLPQPTFSRGQAVRTETRVRRASLGLKFRRGGGTPRRGPGGMHGLFSLRGAPAAHPLPAADCRYPGD